MSDLKKSGHYSFGNEWPVLMEMMARPLKKV
jgi:hypothetical protein